MRISQSFVTLSMKTLAVISKKLQSSTWRPYILEQGGDSCFMSRQQRHRIGDELYRVDLPSFHRRLQSPVVTDLKPGKFNHADTCQMHFYLNYARENWIREGRNPPVGLVLCARKDESVARYALDGLPNKVMAAENQETLPTEALLASEFDRAR